MPPLPPLKTILLFLALLVAAGLGNHFGCPVFFSIEFLFGSIFSMLALQLIGVPAAVAVAVVASLVIAYRWQQPYAAGVMVLEVLVVGWLSRRRGVGLVIADCLYWLFVGMPLVYLLYHQYLAGVGLADIHIAIYMLAINAVANTLGARLLVMLGLFGRGEARLPLGEALFNLLALAVMIPSFLLIVNESRKGVAEAERDVRLGLRDVSRFTDNLMRVWLGQKTVLAVNLAWQSSHQPPAGLQGQLDALRRLDPDLDGLGVMDAKGRSVAFSPLIDEVGDSNIGKDFSDRPYLADLRLTLHPKLTNLQRSRTGELGQPIAILAAPRVKDGVYQGSVAAILNLERLTRTLLFHDARGGVLCTLVDGEHKVIATNRQDVKVMQTFSRGPGTLTHLGDGMDRWLPQAEDGGSEESWPRTSYVVEKAIGGLAEWRLIVEQPLLPMQQGLVENYAGELRFIFLTLLLTLALAEMASRRLISPLVRLWEIAVSLPGHLGERREVAWPRSLIQEVDQLINHFREMAKLLVIKFDEVRQEAERRQRNEQLMIQQAKLAAMGEMLGAIAHQWRQPLNTLGLCIQNIGDAYRHAELNGDYLANTTQQAMGQIRHMSRTIDDFRTFFRPDKEQVAFDTMLAVGGVLRLLSAQLAAHDIAVSLVCHTHDRRFDDVEHLVACPAKRVVGYKNEFEHVILNLVNNAKDAIIGRRARQEMPRDEQGRIAFDFAAFPGHVTITITDNGGGIPTAILPRIFEPYYTTKAPDHGTGIGLYLAKIIIEDHMLGTLAAGNLNGGASFVITLPVEAEAEGGQEEAEVLGPADIYVEHETGEEQ